MKKTVGIVATKARPCSQNSRARQYVQRVVHFVPALTAIAFSSSLERDRRPVQRQAGGTRGS